MKRFNQAWLLNPEIPDPYFGFASLLEMQNKLEEANQFYKMGLEKDVKNERAEICYQRIADCKEQLNDINGTIKAYERIAEINPRNPIAFKKIGYFKMESDREEAIIAFNKAIELDPKDAITFNNRAYMNQTLGNNELAIKDYSRAIELNPDYIGALVNRGITEIELSQFKKAQQDFEKCVTLDPDSGELRRLLGLSKFYQNTIAEACKDFRKALELGDQNVVQLIKDNCGK
jgi:tetratricopeptide (TPR) repeat protein